MGTKQGQDLSGPDSLSLELSVVANTGRLLQSSPHDCHDPNRGNANEGSTVMRFWSDGRID